MINRIFCVPIRDAYKTIKKLQTFQQQPEI